MYNFAIQKKMLEISLKMLEENNISEVAALGGGTALSAFYWDEHRFSTDIDIFIYANEEKKNLLRPNKWSNSIKADMAEIGYTGDFKFQNIYVEFALNKDYKMQFFDVKPFTTTPYTKELLWGQNINIESIEEIIAKKIHYRCEKGNARDLFDIAIAINLNPNILNNLGRLKHNKIELLFDTVAQIKEDKQLFDNYLRKISEMNPIAKYKTLSLKTIDYLYEFLENYCGLYNMGIECDKNDFIEIEKIVYDKWEIYYSTHKIE